MTAIRENVPALDEKIGVAIPVLDHGFIRLIDYMGNDASIVQAARVSYGTGTKKREQDEGLIRYLMRHKHTTPFEMCDIKFHIKLPVFIARQWIRHRTASVNEYSARYSVLEQEFYIPESEHIAAQSQKNKQGREGELAPELREKILNTIKKNAADSYAQYEWMLDEGLARELARMNLPINIYTQWYWKINLHNLLHFIMLRKDSHAQYEIRAYAEILAELVKLWVPLAYQAFEDYHINGVSLSKNGFEIAKALIHGKPIEAFEAQMSQRERDEFYELFSLSKEQKDED